MFLPLDLFLNTADDPLRLVEAAMDHQPTWALGQISPHEQDRHPKHGAHAKRQPPADVHGEQVRVEQNCRQDGADCRTNPPAAVDGQVHMAANSRRDQLVNGGVYSCILPTDSRARQEAAGGEPDEVGREGRGDGSQEVDEQGNHKELLTPKLVGHAGEEQRA